MNASPESWEHEVELGVDDNFTDQGDLNSADLQVDDHDAETSSQETTCSDELSQKLFDLSALIPGSNKIDEFSVISKTIHYLKELHETVTLLEDKKGIYHDESAPSKKKTKVFTDNDVSDISSSFKIEENSGHEINISSEILPEIEARFLKKDVLVRIHCMKSKGLVANILGHLEDLHLSVIRNSVLRFGESRFDITLVAQMEDGFTLTDKELARSLRMALFPSI